MLLEVLVASLIFAIGVLGLVSLQTSMARAQTVSKFRGDAMFLANDLVGHLWGESPTNRAQYNTAQCGSFTRCSDWLAKVASTLPGGVAAVAVVTDASVLGASSSAVTISVSWTTRDGTQTYNTITSVASATP